MSTFNKKIEEWLKETEARPQSAVMIVKLIANRLRDLTVRNEELLAENIALQDGTRVADYQKRIAHLEYQLELLERGASDVSSESMPAESTQATAAMSLLVYNSRGYVFRFELRREEIQLDTEYTEKHGNLKTTSVSSVSEALGRITGELVSDGEVPRFLVLPSDEDVLLIFTSGRVMKRAVADIALTNIGEARPWIKAALPEEPRAGELLACLMPLARLPLADFFLQASRRGCVKKTMTSLAQSILENHYLGKGTVQKSDQPFETVLCQKKERFVLLTHDGRMLGLDVDELPYAAEDRMKLDPTDYVVASFIISTDESFLCLTQTGKVIYREAKAIELAKSASSRGQGLISAARLEQGVRFVGAAPAKEGDRIVVLDAEGILSLYSAGELIGTGAIESSKRIVALGVVSAFAAAEHR